MRSKSTLPSNTIYAPTIIGTPNVPIDNSFFQQELNTTSSVPVVVSVPVVTCEQTAKAICDLRAFSADMVMVNGRSMSRYNKCLIDEITQCSSTDSGDVITTIGDEVVIIPKQQDSPSVKNLKPLLYASGIGLGLFIIYKLTKNKE